MTTEPLRPGDPVTLVLPDHIVQVEVHTSMRKTFVCKLSSRGAKSIDSQWGLEEEGVGWLRGYHHADSPEVQACRTAQALAEEKSPRPHVPTGVQGPPAPIGGFGTSYSGGGGVVSLDEDRVKQIMEKMLKDRER